MSIRLAGAVCALVGSVESTGVTVPPVIVPFDRVRGIGTISATVVAASTSSTIVASTVSATGALIVV